MDIYDLVVWILLITMIFYIRYINIRKIKKNKCENFNSNFNSNFDSTHIEINNLLKILSSYLENNNINYWIIGGTLLGSVRHGQLIPWDDDADIGIELNQIDKLLESNKLLNPLGYEIVHEWEIYKFRKINTNYPFIDIFLYIDDDGIYQMDKQILRNKWPNEYYKYDELFPLKKYKFGDLELSGPNYSLGYLNRMYPNWEYVGIQTYNHKTMEPTFMKVSWNIDYPNPEYKLKPYLKIPHNQIISKNKYDNPYLRELYNLNYNEKIIIVG